MSLLSPLPNMREDMRHAGTHDGDAFDTACEDCEEYCSVCRVLSQALHSKEYGSLLTCRVFSCVGINIKHDDSC